MGEVTIKDITAANVVNENWTVGMTLMLDATNSSFSRLAGKKPTGANVAPLGVVIDSTKLDSAGAVVAGQGAQIRVWGKVTAIASAAVAIGEKVAISNTSGQVATVAQAAGGAQPVPILGVAHTATSNAGDPVEVLLTIGSTW